MSKIETHLSVAKKALEYFAGRYRYTEARVGRQWLWNKKCCGQRMYTAYMYSTEPVNAHCPTHKTTRQAYCCSVQVCGCLDCSYVYYAEPSYY